MIGGDAPCAALGEGGRERGCSAASARAAQSAPAACPHRRTRARPPARRAQVTGPPPRTGSSGTRQSGALSGAAGGHRLAPPRRGSAGRERVAGAAARGDEGLSPPGKKREAPAEGAAGEGDLGPAGRGAPPPPGGGRGAGGGRCRVWSPAGSPARARKSRGGRPSAALASLPPPRPPPPNPLSQRPGLPPLPAPAEGFGRERRLPRDGRGLLLRRSPPPRRIPRGWTRGLSLFRGGDAASSPGGAGRRGAGSGRAGLRRPPAVTKAAGAALGVPAAGAAQGEREGRPQRPGAARPPRPPLRPPPGRSIFCCHRARRAGAAAAPSPRGRRAARPSARGCCRGSLRCPGGWRRGRRCEHVWPGHGER